MNDIEDKYLPGDVLAVRTGSIFGWWIRLGSALRDQPNLDNHIVIVDHTDSNGTLWGIEGRPGGVGWVDCSIYLQGRNAAYTVNNVRQFISTDKRKLITTTCQAMLHTEYDWPAIAADALADLRLPVTWAGREQWGPNAPGHVVCSSLAAWAYYHNNVSGPYTKPSAGVDGGVLKELPLIQPSDWVKWIIDNGYNG